MESTRRILVIDDNRAAHDDFRRMLAPGPGAPALEIESAFQCQDGCEWIRRSLQENRPYALVVVDLRMLAGSEGVETLRSLLGADPDLTVALCAADSDSSLDEILDAFGPADRLAVLRKPLRALEVRQLALVLAQKGRLTREEGCAEDARARQQDLLGALLDSIPDNVYFKDRESRFLRISHAHAQSLGLNDPSEAIGKTDFDFFTPEYARMAFDGEQDIIRTGQPILNVEFKKIHRDGRVAWISTSKWPHHDREGNIIGTFGVSRDITERKHAEETLSYERDLLRALLDNIPDTVYFKDRESRFLRISRSQAHSFGLKDPTEAVGKSDFDFFTVEHAQPAYDDEQQIIRTGRPIVNKEEKDTHADGRVNWVSTTKEPLRDREGNIIGTFGVSRDITERKQAEQALRESEARLRKVAETNEELFRQMTEIIGQVFWLADPAGSRMIYVSPAYEEIWGCPRERLYQSPQMWLESVHPEDRQRVVASLPQPLIRPFAAEYRILRADGSVRWIADRRVPARDASGAIYQIAGVVEDITERKSVEEALIHERDLLRTLIETIPDRIYVKDTQARFLLNNIAHIHSLGATSQEEVVDKTDFDFRTPDLAARYFADDKRIIEEGQPLCNAEMEGVRSTGERGWFRVNKAPLRDLQGKVIGLVGITQDITEWKQAGEALTRERNLLRLRRFHHRAHLLEGGDTGLGQRGGDGLVDFRFRGARRQVGFNQLSLGFLLLRLFRPARLAERVGGVDALLDQRFQHGHFGRFIERLGRIHLQLHERGFDHAECAQTGLLPGLHGRNHVLLHLIDERHDECYSKTRASPMHIKERRLSASPQAPSLPPGDRAMMPSPQVPDAFLPL